MKNRFNSKYLALGVSAVAISFAMAACTQEQQNKLGRDLSLIHISEPTRPY